MELLWTIISLHFNSLNPSNCDVSMRQTMSSKRRQHNIHTRAYTIQSLKIGAGIKRCFSISWFFLYRFRLQFYFRDVLFIFSSLISGLLHQQLNQLRATST